jgi:hypothetical protein
MSTIILKSKNLTCVLSQQCDNHSNKKPLSQSSNALSLFLTCGFNPQICWSNWLGPLSLFLNLHALMFGF